MRKFNVNVNGAAYVVEVEEISAGASAAPAPAVQATPAAPKAAPAAPKAVPVAAAGAEEVKSPMPGNILAVNVKEGDSVKEGDVLMLLEAMKMENEILAPKAGKVTSVQVAKGASVESGDLLAVIG